MLGTQRPKAALLIELRSPQAFSDTERSEFVERIWPFIALANEFCTAQSTISNTHILFTHPEKPLPRAGKGTVQRAPALKLYANELGFLYA